MNVTIQDYSCVSNWNSHTEGYNKFIAAAKQSTSAVGIDIVACKNSSD